MESELGLNQRNRRPFYVCELYLQGFCGQRRARSAIQIEFGDCIKFDVKQMPSSVCVASLANLHFYCITITYLNNFDPLKFHFYIVNLGFTGVYIIFLISAQNIDCGYSLEPPRLGGSNEYPQSMF